MVRHRKNRGFGNEKSFEGKAASGIRKAWAEFIFGKFTFLRRFTIHHSPFTVSLVVAVAALGLCFAVPAHAADKLIVKDAGGTNTVFSVGDTGDMFTGGTDATNSFQFQLMGHAGGSSHVQLVTNQANSRLSVIASTSNDFAPRFQAVGPQDASYPGWVVFDYGSYLFDLPNANFKIRHYNTTGALDMISISGRNTVSFPNGKVGIGTTNPTHLLQLSGGAYSDGATWVSASSRALKENIKDLSAGEAMAAFTKLEPVTFNYKADKDQGHVGFIAEDVPSLVAMKDRKGLSALDIVGVLTKVVQEQQKTITELTARVNKLQQEMNAKGVVALGIK
jgi:Chaperone of endosialidase